MSASYELLHFTPDHSQGEMILLGAIVRQDGADPVFLEHASPLASSLTARTAAALRLYLSGLRDRHAEGYSPGPHLIRAPLRQLPPPWKLDDPVSWVQNAILDGKVLNMRTNQWQIEDYPSSPAPTAAETQ